jgi:hypothetical protein
MFIPDSRVFRFRSDTNTQTQIGRYFVGDTVTDSETRQISGEKSKSKGP